MTLPGIGNSISFLQISNEFGTNGTKSLGGYRYSQTIDGSFTLPLDTGIPTSGTIKFSDFYSKRLNVVVDCFSGGEEFSIDAKQDKWDNQNTIVVSGWGKGRKEEGSRIRIVVNKKIGESIVDATGFGNKNNCALRTGTWNSTSQVVVDVSASGKLLGAGGKGGDGADGITTNAENGGDGTSGLGIEQNNTVVNVYTGGIIRAGFGGGGGGGGGRETSKRDRRAGGGGGGGGAGFPVGKGGKGGIPQAGTNASGAAGKDGDDGTEVDGGNFGPGFGGGGNNVGEVGGGRGGNGGDSEFNATDGTQPGSEHVAPPGLRGLGGGNGAAIRKTSGVSFTIGVNNGTITGSTTETGVG